MQLTAHRHAMSLALLLAIAGGAPADQDDPRVFAVWLKEGVSADPHAESIDGHPCGGVSYRRSATVPVEDAYVVAEQVVEYDRAGVEIGRWRVPVDTAPYAVSGDEILVSDNFESLWIDRAGHARSVPLTHEFSPGADGFTCPDDSCTVFVDNQDGRARRIGSSAICS